MRKYSNFFVLIKPPMHCRTQQRYEPDLRDRDQREQQTWWFSRSFGTGYAHVPKDKYNVLISNNITNICTHGNQLKRRKEYQVCKKKRKGAGLINENTGKCG